MTLQEFSDLFDILYSADTESAATIDEYQKSVYLTKALYLILQEYFNPKANLLLDGFDGSQKRQIDFSTLMRTLTITPEAVTNSPYPALNVYKVSLLKTEASKTDPSKTEVSSIENLRERQILYFINEMVLVTLSNGLLRTLLIIPISHVDLNRTMSKPYGQPLKRLAWRLLSLNSRYNTIETINSENDTDVFILDLYIIVHPQETATDYTVSYVKRPQPIVLLDLSDTSLTVDGINTISNCELDPTIHLEILERAVSLAKIASANLTKTISDLLSKSK